MEADFCNLAYAPNLLIVGAPRSGTTFLWYYLSKHPDIHSAALKEPHYFVHPEWNLGGPERSHYMTSIDQFTRGERDSAWGGLLASKQQYEKLFIDIKHSKYKFEATPNYFHSEYAPKRIATACGNETKIIVVLREPVARTRSHYRLFRRFGWETEPFQEAISMATHRVLVQGWAPTWDYLTYSCIHKPYQVWKQIFGKNMIAVSFDALVSKPRSTLKEIYKWLGVKPTWHLRFKKINATDASKDISHVEADLAIRTHEFLNIDAERDFLSNLFEGQKRHTIV